MWEYCRVAHPIQQEIYDRTNGRFSEANPLGDPNDLVAMRAALDVLRWHREKP